LQSPAYEKARKKNPLLPEITDRASLENTFKLLPMSMLALRVTKVDAHAGHDHKKPKRVKGLWTVKIEPQQEAKEEMYYAWFYEGSQVMRKVYAAIALLVIFLIVCYPLWPLKLRQGVYYLSWGFLGLLGLFFLMAIFRVILFCITYFTNAPGLWLFPNLWEDVSFLDSFKPVWAWHEVSFIHSLVPTATNPLTLARPRRRARRRSLRRQAPAEVQRPTAPSARQPANPPPPLLSQQRRTHRLSPSRSSAPATLPRGWRSLATTSRWVLGCRRPSGLSREGLETQSCRKSKKERTLLCAQGRNQGWSWGVGNMHKPVSHELEAFKPRYLLCRRNGACVDGRCVAFG
jgi:translocation protein SEC62